MARIVIYDSGVGGLSVHQSLSVLLPANDYIFISDNAAFPYGTKSDSELEQRVLPVVANIVDRVNPDLLVVACNTVSTALLGSLRSNHPSLEIVGVVPAIKPAAKLSKLKVIGLLATPGTIKRDYTQRLIKDFASNCVVISVGSSELVKIAEDKLNNLELDTAKIELALKPFIDCIECDVLVLACTHFPLLNEEIGSAFRQAERTVALVDSGQAIAKRVDSLLDSLTADGSLSADGSLRAEGSYSMFTKPLDPGSQLRLALAALGLPYAGCFEV